MSFYNWMNQSHINDSTMIGAVARIMTSNKRLFRRVRSYTKARACLEQLHPRKDYLDALAQAWDAYRKHQMQSADA